jgi:hypothetical protein
LEVYDLVDNIYKISKEYVKEVGYMKVRARKEYKSRHYRKETYHGQEERYHEPYVIHLDWIPENREERKALKEASPPRLISAFTEEELEEKYRYTVEHYTTLISAYREIERDKRAAKREFQSSEEEFHF